jgi:ribonuclease G
MSKELVISSNRHETKLAILEDDQLVEVYFQHSDEYSLAGSVHKGRVTRVLPGMQSAFVDLGLERDTFLYVSDFFEESGEDVDRISSPGGRDERGGRHERREDRNRGDRDRFRQEQPQAAAAPEESAAADVPAATGESNGPAERSGDRTEEGEGRDHRNRRSRRRRNRGRGFPESKYASAGKVVASETEAEAVEDEPAGSAEAVSEDFLLLPGESVAKYTRPEPENDIREASETSAAEQSNESAGDDLDADAESVDEPLGMPALADVEEVQAAAEEAIAAETGRKSPTIAAAPAEEHHAAAVAETAAVETLAAAATSEATAAPAEETTEEDAVLDAVEALDEEDSADDASPAADDAAGDAEQVAGGEEAEGGEEAAAAVPAAESGSAQVRENGGRYLQHRVARRPRRRQRGRHDERPQNGAPEEQSRSEAAPARSETATVSRPDRSTPSITELLKEGQEIIVQIAKEPLGQKGARITSHIALPGRYVVYMPTVEHTGVSRKIASDEERQRLKRILQTHRAGAPGGFILRTAGEGHTEEEIAADMNFLFNLWLDIRQKAEKNPAPVLLHHDLDIVQRILRDQLTDSFKSIWVDNEEVYENVLRFVQRFQPALVGRVKLFTRPEPIFDAFNISAELEKALRPKVWLKSGGYIVINQTEALVAIDVNTGKYVGKSNRLEDTIVKTNTEAVKEIVRQIRLRDLGGIIVVDFIDMDERRNRQKVMQTLEEAMRVDRAPYKILQFNDFGLVAITRKRVKQSLERALCAPCPYCEGAGYVKSVQTTVSEILQEAHKIRKAVADNKDVILRVHPEVAKMLKSHNNRYLEEIEETLGKPVMVKSDLALHQEKFDLA